MNTIKTAADKLYPQAAALGVALEAVAPGLYTVEPMDSYDGAGNRLYAIAETREGRPYAVSGLTYGQALVWVGERADDVSSATRPVVELPGLGVAAYADGSGAPTARGVRAMFDAIDRARGR